MIRGSGLYIRKIILNILLFSGVTVSVFSQGTSIGGVINKYMSVVSLGPDNATLNDASMLAAGDTVLLIQMKGAVILGLDDNSYGTYQYSQGTTGAYEFLIIESINYPARNVVFTSNLANTYDTYGNIQLIRVPYYKDATVTSELNAEQWDSVTTKTGGVLAMIVEGTLNLNANIIVDGAGLIGGIPSPGDGICTNANAAVYDKYAYPETFTNSGYKGEGLAGRVLLTTTIPPINPDFVKGKGSNFTGGGGGNGRFSGGGGGSGAGGFSESKLGSGGTGGVESDAVCGAGFQFGNGLGGKTLYNNISGGVYPGSGGGSATFGSPGTATTGGRGGGIIIIICDTLKGNGKIISANGGTPAGISSGNAGAGGGGGGGTIALYQQNLASTSTALILTANGGNGGNANNRFGEGGGGGGGLILTSNLSFPANVTMTANGGLAGTRTGGSLHANPGLIGGDTLFTPLLNGFLFNNLHSSVSKNQIDSVCSNMIPPKIIGTRPIGGTGTYTYIWQKSYESTFSSPIVLTNDIDPKNYTPKAADAITPTDTVWFRRIVMDAGPPAITDISKAVKIIVQPGISNNNIGEPDTFCQTGDPLLIKQLIPDLIVPSPQSLFYTWQDSSSTGPWATVASSKEFDPPAGLVNTTAYRRIVTSGSCIDTSLTVKMTVLPSINGNRIFSPAEDSICFGTGFQAIKGTTKTGTIPVLAGGTNSFIYKWESSINFSPWVTADGISDRDSINPVELIVEGIPSNYYQFRRIVYSGPDSVCSDISDTVHLRDFPHITNYNLLTGANPTICSGTAPGLILGNPPNNGNGLFTWQDSINSVNQWRDITGYVNTDKADYQPAVLTSTTKFRRIAHSWGCTATSDPVEIAVLAPIVNNVISLRSAALDTTICTGPALLDLAGTTNPSGGAGGPYSYQWLYSTSSTVLTEIAGATQASYNPASLTLNVSTDFRRQVMDKQSICRDTSSSVITVNVLPPVANNTITPGQSAVCDNALPDPVNGTSPTGGGGSGSYIYFWEESSDGGLNWIPARGTNTLRDYQPPVLTTPYRYRRTVTSGLADCCTGTSPEVEISINPAPLGPVFAGDDGSTHSIEKKYTLNADPAVVPGESGFWTSSTSSFADYTNSKTEAGNLTIGSNLFVWTITNGLCNIDDSVYIELLPFIIPQGFSPNGDAWNNKFMIDGLNLSDTQIAELNIINGAGTVVFTTTNKDGQEWVDWDGRNSKGVELPEGTYYYLLKLTTTERRVFKESGFVELKRY